MLGVIVQFGGQTPLKLAAALERAQIPILGTSPDAIDLAEDRRRFQGLLTRLGLRQPENGTAYSAGEAEAVALRIGYPVLIRPSYVLGGRAMEIVHDLAGLNRYMRHAVSASGSSPVLIDRYLQDAIEIDVDAIADGVDVEIAGIMEHIEEAGIHSGDSACSLPPYSLTPATIGEIERQTVALAMALRVVGLMNVQFAVKDGDIYVLEVNPRASRTVPFVAKATGVPIAKIAARVMAGERLADCRGARPKRGGHVAVKEAVFPFARFPGVDLILGPEMKSTGEVMGLDADFGRAFAKSQLASGTILPLEGLRLRLGARPRQAGAGRAVPPAGRDGVCAGRDPRHRRSAPRRRAGGDGGQQGARRAPAHRRPYAERRGSAGVQHHRGQPGDRRQLQPETNGADPCDPLLHDRRRGAGGGPGDRRIARRKP